MLFFFGGVFFLFATGRTETDGCSAAVVLCVPADFFLGLGLAATLFFLLAGLVGIFFLLSGDRCGNKSPLNYNPSPVRIDSSDQR